jgi:hypothetical protein
MTVVVLNIVHSQEISISYVRGFVDTVLVHDPVPHSVTPFCIQLDSTLYDYSEAFRPSAGNRGDEDPAENCMLTGLHASVESASFEPFTETEMLGVM